MADNTVWVRIEYKSEGAANIKKDMAKLSKMGSEVHQSSVASVKGPQKKHVRDITTIAKMSGKNLKEVSDVVHKSFSGAKVYDWDTASKKLTRAQKNSARATKELEKAQIKANAASEEAARLEQEGSIFADPAKGSGGLVGGGEKAPKKGDDEQTKFNKNKAKQVQRRGFQRTYDKNVLNAQIKGLNGVSKAFKKVSWASQKLGSQKNQFQRIGWGFTMMSLSALGVYFSMLGLVNIFKSATMALFGQLQDLDGAFSALGHTIAFGGEKGEEVLNILGGQDAIIDNIVEGWQRVLGVVGTYKTIMVNLAGNVFDQATTDAIMDVAIELAKAFQNPDTVEGIRKILIAIMELLPGFVDIIPPVANLIGFLADSGLLGTMVKLMVVAVLMMPILSAIAAVFQTVGAVVKVVDILMLAFGSSTVVAGGAAAGTSAGGLAAIGAKLAFLINPITGIIALIIAIISIFGWWDDIARVLGKTFGWFGDVLKGPIDMLMKFVDLAGKGLALIGDIIGSKIFGSEYTSNLSQEELDKAGKNRLIGGLVPKVKGGTPSDSQLGGGYSSPIAALDTLGFLPNFGGPDATTVQASALQAEASHTDLMTINESLKMLALSDDMPKVSNIENNYYITVTGNVDGMTLGEEIDAYNESQRNRGIK